jgi:hypothetical protein
MRDGALPTICGPCGVRISTLFEAGGYQFVKAGVFPRGQGIAGDS